MTNPDSAPSEQPSGKQAKIGAIGWAWIVGVFGFSVARALVAWPTLGRFGVNPWVFLAIDVVTAFPYAYGQVRLVKAIVHRAAAAVQWWALVVLVTFLAPYAYIFAAGSGELPFIGYVIVSLLVVVFGVASVARIRQNIRNARSATV